MVVGSRKASKDFMGIRRLDKSLWHLRNGGCFEPKCQRNYPFEVFFVKLKSDKKFDEEVDVGTLTFVVDVVTVEILVRTWVNLIPRHYNKRWHCLQQSSQTHINNYTTQQKGGFPLSRTKKTWFPIFDAVEAIISIYPKKKQNLI